MYEASQTHRFNTVVKANTTSSDIEA